jgi:rhodanese-related sulfurtransferase
MSGKFIDFSSKTTNPYMPDVDDVTPDELHEKIREVCVVDVRRPDEWVGEYGHIAEAELMTLNTLPDAIERLPKTQTIVFVCRSGNRSAQATAFAKQNGFTSVYNLRGGMIEWTNKNFATVERDGE